MRQAKDTFLMFLKSNLSTLDPAVTVHVMRKDPNNPSTSQLQVDAVNVGFGRVDFGVATSTLYAKIDIVCNSEITAGYITQQLWLLLSSSFYTPLYDYSVPNAPVAVGTMLMWKPHSVRFTPVDYDKDDKYFRYSSTLPLEYREATN